MSEKVSLQRVTFSPGEFASLFGKSQTWGYRQIYAGKVTTITEYGRIMIPAAEVERILGTAGAYDGKKKALRPKTKAEFRAMKPQLQTAWDEFLRTKRAGTSRYGKQHAATLKFVKDNPAMRNAALRRLATTKEPENSKPR